MEPRKIKCRSTLKYRYIEKLSIKNHYWLFGDDRFMLLLLLSYAVHRQELDALRHT